MRAETPWRSGRFDAGSGPKKILFGRMYEDSAIEQAAFPEGSRVFCIASAGDMARALAPGRSVTAVDINPIQLEYARARAAGETAEHGSAERVMGIGRNLMALFGWRRSTIETFLALEDPIQQLVFWNRRLNGLAFRTATDVLLSASRLNAIYASPFLEVLPARFGQVLRARLERCFATHPNKTNPYARALLLGELSEPPPAAPISERSAQRIHFVAADAASFLESCAPGSFDGFTLSNILDGAPEGYRTRLSAAVAHAASERAVVVTRSIAEPEPGSRTNQAMRDRSILWGIVDVRPVHPASA